MERGYKVGLNISMELRTNCIALFKECKEFSDPTSLRAFATVRGLEHASKCMPVSDRLDYNALITNMLRAGRSPLESALFDLLDALAREYEGDWKGKRCKELKEAIRIELLQAEKPEQEKDYLRLVADGPAGDRQQADGDDGPGGDEAHRGEAERIAPDYRKLIAADYRIELKISKELRRDCVELFKNCGQFFENPSKLRAFTESIKGLELVTNSIPTSEKLDRNELINGLLRNGRTMLEPALFDLLDALAFEYPGDWKEGRCKELKAAISNELLLNEKAENPEQEKVYVRRADQAASDGRGAGESAGRWIEEAGDDLDELALRISLAVFNGTAFEVIEGAKKELFEMLQPLVPQPPPPDPEKPPPVAPRVPLMRRLEKAGARETKGKPPDWRRVVELERPELAVEAIIYVWQLNRETEWRKKLIEWLTSHAAGRHPADVRICTAVAVGILAVKDYRFVREKLLKAWVRRNDPQFRTAVGRALGVLVREESLSAEVQGLLREWAGSPEEAQRWAAMRAYIYVGAYCRPPGEAIARWREIAASEQVAVYIPVSENEYVRLNNPLHMSLMDAMERFFAGVTMLPEEERRSVFGGVLGELKEWIAADDNDAWLGLFTFTALGQLTVSADVNGESGGVPLLLQLVEEESDETGYRAQLAGLFELALRNGATITAAKELLCAWLGWADGLRDKSQSFESRIRTLFKEIIAADEGGRARGKLAACLRDCGRNRTAQNILADL